MSVELKYLALVATLTALIWVPYVLNRLMVGGIMDAVGYPRSPKAGAPWAERMKAAHYNAVENLVVFAALVLIANAIGVKNEATAMAAMIYFWARAAHLAAYTFAIPWVRTLAFTAGFVCQMVFAWQILMR